MYCRTEETEEAAKKRTNKQRLLTAGRLSSRLREELAAEEWQNEASSSLSSRLQEEVAAEEWQNEASSSLSSRLQEEVEAEELQKQVYMHEHAEAKESVLLLHALNERLLQRGGPPAPTPARSSNQNNSSSGLVCFLPA